MLGYPFPVTETDNKHPNLTHCSEEWIYSCVLSRKQTIRGLKAGSAAGKHTLEQSWGFVLFCLLNLADLINPA